MDKKCIKKDRNPEYNILISSIALLYQFEGDNDRRIYRLSSLEQDRVEGFNLQALIKLIFNSIIVLVINSQLTDHPNSL